MNYYAVYKGIKPGIYSDWKTCEMQIKGFSNAKYRKCNSKTDAECYMKNGKINLNNKVLPLKNKPKSLENYFKINTNDNVINVYTDGSLVKKKNFKKAGYGIYIPQLDLKISKELGGKLTNNRAELTAIIEAFQYFPQNKHICLYTDSKYCMYLVTGTGLRYQKNNFIKIEDGKTVTIPNKDLIIQLLNLLPKYKIIFRHIKAHTESDDIHSRGNAMADILAKESIN